MPETPAVTLSVDLLDHLADAVLLALRDAEPEDTGAAAATAVLAALVDAGYVVVPAPSFAYKGPGETDASRAREVADRIARGALPGSNSRQTAAVLLERCAAAMEANEVPTQRYTAEDLQYGLHIPEEGSYVGPLDERHARAVVDGPNPKGLGLAHRIVGPWVTVRRG